MENRKSWSQLDASSTISENVQLCWQMLCAISSLMRLKNCLFTSGEGFMNRSDDKTDQQARPEWYWRCLKCIHQHRGDILALFAWLDIKSKQRREERERLQTLLKKNIKFDSHHVSRFKSFISFSEHFAPLPCVKSRGDKTQRGITQTGWLIGSKLTKDGRLCEEQRILMALHISAC